MTHTKLNSHGHRVIVHDKDNVLTWSDQSLRTELFKLYVADYEQRSQREVTDDVVKSLNEVIGYQSRLQLIDEISNSHKWS